MSKTSRLGFLRNRSPSEIDLEYLMYKKSPNRIRAKLKLVYVGLDIVVTESNIEYYVARGARLPAFSLNHTEFPNRELAPHQEFLWRTLRSLFEKEIRINVDEQSLYKNLNDKTRFLLPRHLSVVNTDVGRFFLCNEHGVMAFYRSIGSRSGSVSLTCLGISQSHPLKRNCNFEVTKPTVRIGRSDFDKYPPNTPEDSLVRYLKWKLLTPKVGGMNQVR